MTAMMRLDSPLWGVCGHWMKLINLSKAIKLDDKFANSSKVLGKFYFIQL